MAIYFLIASANMAAICYVALVLALPPLLDTLGKHISVLSSCSTTSP